MPSLFYHIKQWIVGVSWLAIARTLVIQVIVLSALAFAVTSYLTWTSEMAQEEFEHVIGQTASGLLSQHKRSERLCERR